MNPHDAVDSKAHDCTIGAGLNVDVTRALGDRTLKNEVGELDHWCRIKVGAGHRFLGLFFEDLDVLDRTGGEIADDVLELSLGRIPNVDRGSQGARRRDLEIRGPAGNE